MLFSIFSANNCQLSLILSWQTGLCYEVFKASFGQVPDLLYMAFYQCCDEHFVSSHSLYQCSSLPTGLCHQDPTQLVWQPCPMLAQLVCRCRYVELTLFIINIQSSFTVQNPRTQLDKIEHVILLYLTSANLDSALLAITYKNRALLTMADFFVNVFSL